MAATDFYYFGKSPNWCASVVRRWVLSPPSCTTLVGIVHCIPYTVRLAQRGFVGILANTAGPAAVGPFGSVDPITGTNPICFSFPTPSGVPQTSDFATSEVVWGEIRQATLEGRGLVSGPFLSSAGDVTTARSEVDAVRAFVG